MKTAMTILCVTVMALSPCIRSAYAGAVQPTPVSADEARCLASAEVASAPQLADLAAGDEGDAAIGALIMLGLILLVAAAASAGSGA